MGIRGGCESPSGKIRGLTKELLTDPAEALGQLDVSAWEKTKDAPWLPNKGC